MATALLTRPSRPTGCEHQVHSLQQIGNPRNGNNEEIEQVEGASTKRSLMQDDAESNDLHPHPKTNCVLFSDTLNNNNYANYCLTVVPW